MEYCKLQIGCMIIVLYVACIYIREKQIYQMKRKNVLFETILAAGIGASRPVPDCTPLPSPTTTPP